MPGMNEYIIARTAFFDGLFTKALEEKVPQIVLLGAGYDSRTYRFSHLNKGTRIFEVDAPATQDRKVSCLQKAKISIPNQVRFVPINFKNDKPIPALEKAGYSSGERTLFLWEGVSMYLPMETVQETLDLVGQSGNREHAIAFDYCIPLTKETMGEYYGAEPFLKAMAEHHTGEGLFFSQTEAGMAAFLRERGFEVVEMLDGETMEKRYLTDEAGALIGNVSGFFRFVVARRQDEYVQEVGEPPAER